MNLVHADQDDRRDPPSRQRRGPLVNLYDLSRCPESANSSSAPQTHTDERAPGRVKNPWRTSPRLSEVIISQRSWFQSWGAGSGAGRVNPHSLITNFPISDRMRQVYVRRYGCSARSSVCPWQGFVRVRLIPKALNEKPRSERVLGRKPLLGAKSA